MAGNKRKRAHHSSSPSNKNKNKNRTFQSSGSGSGSGKAPMTLGEVSRIRNKQKRSEVFQKLKAAKRKEKDERRQNRRMLELELGSSAPPKLVSKARYVLCYVIIIYIIQSLSQSIYTYIYTYIYISFPRSRSLSHTQ